MGTIRKTHPEVTHAAAMTASSSFSHIFLFWIENVHFIELTFLGRFYDCFLLLLKQPKSKVDTVWKAEKGTWMG